MGVGEGGRGRRGRVGWEPVHQGSRVEHSGSVSVRFMLGSFVPPPLKLDKGRVEALEPESHLSLMCMGTVA